MTNQYCSKEKCPMNLNGFYSVEAEVPIITRTVHCLCICAFFLLIRIYVKKTISIYNHTGYKLYLSMSENCTKFLQK